jgi:hypothetical protein
MMTTQQGRAGGSPIMSYFADVGPRSGPILWRDGFHVLGVLEARDADIPVGRALGCGFGWDGVALWRLHVRGVEVPGRWVVVAREFIPEELGDAGPAPARPPG